MRMRILMLGRTRRPELRALLEDYLTRIRRYVPLEMIEVRDGDAALRRLEADRAATPVFLEAWGKQFDSVSFAQWLGELRDRGTRELVFVCGGAEGFPDALRGHTHQKLSLSAMTFSHELARVVLAEQIYRALAILSGGPYPK